jgi:hypothetical protein
MCLPVSELVAKLEEFNGGLAPTFAAIQINTQFTSDATQFFAPTDRRLNRVPVFDGSLANVIEVSLDRE